MLARICDPQLPPSVTERGSIRRTRPQSEEVCADRESSRRKSSARSGGSGRSPVHLILRVGGRQNSAERQDARVSNEQLEDRDFLRALQGNSVLGRFTSVLKYYFTQTTKVCKPVSSWESF